MKRCAAALAAGLLILLFPVCARASDDTAAAVQTRTGEWTDTRSAMPGEELRCRAALTLSTGESWTVRSVLPAGMEFRSLTAVSAGGESVNASYYTLVTGARSPGSAFTLHLAPRFAREERVRLTVEWTARLGDGCAAGTEGNGFSLEAESESGAAVSGSAAAVYTYGFSVFRGVGFADAAVPDHPLASACFRLYYDAAMREPVAFRERGGAYLACTGKDCAHSRHTYILRTAESGRVRIEGLAAGTYYLQESRPPSGYERSADALRVTVSETGAAGTDGAVLSGDTLLLLERAQEAPSENGALAFYRRGCGVMVALFTTVLCGKRRYL